MKGLIKMAKVNQLWIFCIFIVAFLYTLPAKAQYYDDDENRLFTGGIIFGANYSQVDGDNFAGYHRVGINAGVLVHAHIMRPVTLSMELLFAQKGARSGQTQVPRLANDQSTVITDYKIKLNYAEIPLLINYMDTKRNNFGVGFAYGYLTGSRELFMDGSGVVYEQEAKLFPFRKSDLSFVLNGGAHIWKGIVVNLRMQYSIFSVRNASNYLTGRQQQFNNVVSTRLVYLF